MYKNRGGGGYLGSKNSGIAINFEQGNRQNKGYTYPILQVGQNCENTEKCNKISVDDKNKLNNLTKEKDTFKNNVLLAKLCELKVEEKRSYKLSEEYIKMNNDFIKKNTNSCTNMINNELVTSKNNYKNNDVYEVANKNNYINNNINQNICARIEIDEGKFSDKLNIDKTDNKRLNKKQLGFNKVNSAGYTQNKNTSVLQKLGNVRGNTSKSIPKKITTAIICLWLFVLCAWFSLVVGFEYSDTKNNNLNFTPNTTTAEGAFSGGDGTQNNPYQIANYTDLKALSTNCNNGMHYKNTYFKVTSDITINNTDSATEWVPIGVDLTSTGTPVNYFSGVLDGAKHTITVSGSITGSLSITGPSTTSTGTTIYLYFGAIFGFVDSGEVKNLNVNFSLGESKAFDVTTSISGKAYLQFAGIVGGCQSSTIANCDVGGDTIAINTGNSSNYSILFGGIVGRGLGDSSVDKCNMSANYVGMYSGTYEYSLGGGIVFELEGTVTGCVVNSDLVFRDAILFRSTCGGCGGIAGKATTVEDCIFSGSSLICALYWCEYAGGIVGQATTVRNCKIIGIGTGVDVTMDITANTSSMSSPVPRIGLIAGQADYIENCYVSENVKEIYCCGDSRGYAGVIAGQATTIKNCLANVSIETISASQYGYFSFIVGNVTTSTDENGATVNPTINNCFINANVTKASGSYIYSLCSVDSSATLTAYNCVVVGSTYGLTDSNTAITDSTNGLYALSSDDAKLSELKKSETYQGSGANGFTWNTTDGTAWDLEGTWGIETEGETYPTLVFDVPVIITISITTNASTDNAAGVDKFIIYKLDNDNNVVNQYVVTNGSAITFEAVKKQQFTLMINHKLYMVATIDGVSTLRQTYSPTEDTTINITITAPSSVNAWVVI